MDEYNLIASAKKGDKKSFQDLIIFYYPYVTKFLLKLCNDESLSEDLTQETFLKLIRGIEKFDIHGKAAFATYVMQIAKNTYIDYLRKNKQIILNLEEHEMVSKENPQDAVIKGMQLNELLQILESLPPEQAVAIKLKYVEQLTLSEIAEKFQCEPKTIKSRIHNGIVKLRLALKGEFYYE